MNNLTPFSAGSSLDQEVHQNEVRHESSSAYCDDEYLSQAADFGIQHTTNSGFFCTSSGTETEKQLKAILNKKIQLAKRQNLDSLSSTLNHCHIGLGSEHRLRDHFPTKLYTMLELSAHVDGSSSNAFAWLPHGRAFQVPDEHTFRSFHRLLTLWGFKR
ncbi:hypothetical protein ACHAXR_008193 [Thalassiosira sp. AJA248-18]